MFTLFSFLSAGSITIRYAVVGTTVGTIAIEHVNHDYFDKIKEKIQQYLGENPPPNADTSSMRILYKEKVVTGEFIVNTQNEDFEVSFVLVDDPEKIAIKKVMEIFSEAESGEKTQYGSAVIITKPKQFQIKFSPNDRSLTQKCLTDAQISPEDVKHCSRDKFKSAHLMKNIQ